MKKKQNYARKKMEEPVQTYSTNSARAEVGRLLTVPEAADRLGVKPATIRCWILRREKLEVVRIGRCVRLTERSINVLINSNIVEPER